MTTRKHSHRINSHLLEYITAMWRYKKITEYISNECTILDVGCGFSGSLLFHVLDKIQTGYGLDISVNSNINNEKIKLIEWDLHTDTFPQLPLFDIVTCLAVLEHVKDPAKLLRSIFNSLKNNGKLLLTVPSWKSKPVLEFLAFKLGALSKQEIADHKRYFNKEEIVNLCKEAGFLDIRHKYFQLGLNNFVLAKKYLFP